MILRLRHGSLNEAVGECLDLRYQQPCASLLVLRSCLRSENDLRYVWDWSHEVDGLLGA